MGERERDQWEYRSLQPPRESTMKEAKDPTDALNDLGADGWELADSIDYVGGGTKLLLLKRPAASGGKEDGTDDVDDPREGNEPVADDDPAPDDE